MKYELINTRVVHNCVLTRLIDIYVFQGLASLTSTAVSTSNPDGNRAIQSSFLSWSLYLISLAQGLYNPSLQAFGADQLDDDEDLSCSQDEKRSNKKTVFFKWWYFGICTGSLLGTIIMSYIQDTFGWVLGFEIPAFAMALSILIFSWGSHIYIYKDGDSKARYTLFNMIKSIKTFAFKCFSRCEISLPKDQSELNEME